MSRILNCSRVERIRLNIIKDLVKFDLLTCKPINPYRGTAHLTRVLPDDETMPDHNRTNVDFFNATTSKVAAV